MKTTTATMSYSPIPYPVSGMVMGRESKGLDPPPDSNTFLRGKGCGVLGWQINNCLSTLFCSDCSEVLHNYGLVGLFYYFRFKKLQQQCLYHKLCIVHEALHNVPKCVILQEKVQKISGEGACPLHRNHPGMEGDTFTISRLSIRTPSSKTLPLSLSPACNWDLASISTSCLDSWPVSIIWSSASIQSFVVC